MSGWSEEEKRYIVERYLSMVAGECRNIGDVWAFKQTMNEMARVEIERLDRLARDHAGMGER